MILKFEEKHLIDFINMLRKTPRKLQFSISNTLNSIAFGARRSAIKTIDDKMTIRNQPFIVGSVRFKKSNPRNLQSEVGSIGRQRFSGLVEQETGKTTERKRTFTKEARAGNDVNIVRPTHRLKAGNKFVTPNDYGGRVIGMLMALKRQKYKKPFVVSRHRKLRKGLYKFNRGKLRMLQDFRPKYAQPKRVKWLTIGVNQYFKKTDLNKVWAKSVKTAFKRR